MYGTRMPMSTYYPDVQAAASLQLQADQQYTTYMNSAPAPAAGPETAPAPQPMTQPRAASTAWSKEDDETLMSARASGLNWSQIQQRYFSSKTSNACRKRHERLIERKTADNWNKTDFERLSMEYMRIRKEIWTPLATQVGEKWNVVEQKVSASSSPSEHALGLKLTVVFTDSACLMASKTCKRRLEPAEDDSVSSRASRYKGTMMTVESVASA